jgi:hypothetical protein
MKKVGTIIVIILLLTSCSLEEIINELAPDMTAKINGTEWKASIPYSVIEDDKYILTGISLNGKSISITINGTSSGIYELSLTSTQCTAIYKESTSNSLDDAYLAISGVVNLSAVDTDEKTISGTFSFTVIRDITESAIEITEGKFSYLPYTEDSGQ